MSYLLVGYVLLFLGTVAIQSLQRIGCSNILDMLFNTPGENISEIDEDSSSRSKLFYSIKY